MDHNMNQKEVSKANTKFWDELCGSQLAKVLGIEDDSPESLKKFDDWYFEFYPYLDACIDFNVLKGKDVLEVGLGYGTVSQKLASCSGNYRGLDIALGPVNMVNHRLKQNSMRGYATQGSILNPPFEQESFDAIVAIGCLHHTGDLRRAISECYRLLRPEGRLIFMVYYAYSYRRWIQASGDTLKYFIKELSGSRDVVGYSSSKHRAAYDTNESGEGAPHTDWISRKSLGEFCREFSSFNSHLENIDVLPGFKFWSRDQLLRTKIPEKLGLDLYVVATK